MLGNISAPPTSTDGVLITGHVVGDTTLNSHFDSVSMDHFWYQLSRSFSQETYSDVDLPAGILLERVYLPRSKERRIGLRQALNCDSMTTKVSTDPMRSLEAGTVLQICLKLRQWTGSLKHFIYQLIRYTLLLRRGNNLEQGSSLQQKAMPVEPFGWVISRQHFLICIHLSLLLHFLPMLPPLMYSSHSHFLSYSWNMTNSFMLWDLKNLLFPESHCLFSPDLPIVGSSWVFKYQGSKVISPKKPSLTTPKYTPLQLSPWLHLCILTIIFITISCNLVHLSVCLFFV